MAQAWEYAGIDLTRIGYNVRLLGAPLSVPERRGDNLVIPQKVGRYWVPKALDQRIVSLAMYVRNVPASGGTASEANMLANLDVLRGLFAQPGQHLLKHQFGSVVREQFAEVVNLVEFQPAGKLNVYNLVVEFLLASPMWLAQTTTTVGPTNLTTNPQNVAVTNPGSYRAEGSVLTLKGEIVDPVLTCSGVWVKYTGTVASGNSLVINCASWTALNDGLDVSGDISHEGDLIWLVIPPGVQTVRMDCASMDAAALTVAFKAAYV
jgi:hypothetical protein